MRGPARREGRRNDPSSRFGAALSEWMSRSQDFDLRRRCVGRRRIRSGANPSDPAVHFDAVVPSSPGETASVCRAELAPDTHVFPCRNDLSFLFRCAGRLFIAPQKGGFAAWDMYFCPCRPADRRARLFPLRFVLRARRIPNGPYVLWFRLHFRIGTIAVSRLRREGRTFAASWKVVLRLRIRVCFRQCFCFKQPRYKALFPVSEADDLVLVAF